MISPARMNLNTGGNRVGRWSSVRMSALGHSRTFAVQKGMSASPPEADMCGATRDVRYVPIADIGRSHAWRHMIRVSRVKRPATDRRHYGPSYRTSGREPLNLLEPNRLKGCSLLSRRPQTAHDADLRHHSYRGVQRSRERPCAASVRD